MKQRYYVILMSSVHGHAVLGNAKGEPFTSRENATRSCTRRRAGLPKEYSLKIFEVQG